MTNVLMSSYTLDELKAVITQVLLEAQGAQPQPSTKNYIYGIIGLSKFLKCSRPTAQRFKNSGKLPFSQTGRKIIFEESEVLKAIQKKGGIAR